MFGHRLPFSPNSAQLGGQLGFGPGRIIKQVDVAVFAAVQFFEPSGDPGMDTSFRILLVGQRFIDPGYDLLPKGIG
ncbi:MAG TPA: hypothetical protein VG015_03055 [Candidatus Dormibacteraeota bacterium]|nr:hypothetical protein [Candidatus Dormibacteraeota bacterium]